MASPLFGLIRVPHCALHKAGDVFLCQGSDDYQRIRPEAGARFVLEFSMPIAWPAVADGVAQGTAPNRAFIVKPAATVATWLLMLVAVIVWNPGIGFFAYGTIKGIGTHFASGLVASNLWILPGRAGLRIGTGRRCESGRLAASPKGSARGRGSVSLQVV